MPISEKKKASNARCTEMNDETQVFAPYRCVAAFADGFRQTFDGLTRNQARANMEAAMEQHGDIGWWNWVSDINYRSGEYCGLISPPPHLPFPLIDVTDAENPQKALQDPFDPDGEP